MERREAIALLNEMLAEHAVIPTWVDLEKEGPDLYKLQIKPLYVDLNSLKRIVEKHNFELKEAEGRLVILQKAKRVSDNHKPLDNPSIR